MSHRNRSRTIAWLALVSTTVVAGFASATLAQAELKDPPKTAPAAPASQAEPVKPANDLPKAEALFDKAIEAMGGREAFKKLESMHTIASLSHPMLPAPMTFDLSRDNKDRFYFKQGGPMGDVTAGNDGTTAWMNHPMMGGYKILEGAEKDMIKEQTMVVRHDIVENLKEEAKEMQTIGSETFTDEDTWKVKVVDKDLQESTLYFSKDTGRLLGMTATQEGPMGTTDVKMRFLEWKEFEPFTFYTKMELEQGPQTLTFNFDTIELNNVDPKIYELPEEVKKLVEEKKTAPTPAEGATPPAGGVPHDHDGDGKPDH